MISKKGRSNSNKIVLSAGLICMLFVFAVPVNASAFWFNGTTYNETGTPMGGVNVSVEVYNFTLYGPNLITTNETVSNATTGLFNISVPESDKPYTNPYFYKPVIKYFNSTTGHLDYIGQSLPELPAEGIMHISPINFYLRPGGTINITAVNESGDPVNFNYMVKDTKLGYPIAENFNSEVANATIYVPAERSYSIMIYPNQSMPISYELNNLTDDYTDDYANITDHYANITFNTSTLLRRVAGHANLTGGAFNFTNLSIITYLIEPGDMVFQDHPMPYNMSAWNYPTPESDTYDAANGTYNITLPGAKMTANMLLFATAYNQTTDTYYGAFRNISLNYSEDAVADFNFTMYELLGSQTNISIDNADWSSGIPTVNVTTNKSSFQLKNKTSTTNITGFAHVEVKVNYSAYNGATFSWMVDVKQGDNGSFSIPAISADIEKINVFTQDFAPLKTKKTAAQLATQPVSINLSSFDPGAIKPGDDVNLGIRMDMFKSTAECDVPYPAAGCSLFGGKEKNESHFDPFKIVLGGGKISLRMVSASNITVHYKNVDMLASGPPDALFDPNGTKTQSDSTLDEVWRFGSMGPEIYDEVLVGIPLNSTLNASNVTVKLGKLYDNDWNEIWNMSVNNISDIPSDYSDFNTTWFNNTTGMPCSTTNESADCYVNTTDRIAWLNIPHFSGIGPTISGTTTTSTSSSGTSSGISWNYTDGTVYHNYTITDDVLNSTNWVRLIGGNIEMPAVNLSVSIDGITLTSGNRLLNLSSATLSNKITTTPKHKVYTVGTNGTANVTYYVDADQSHFADKNVSITTYKQVSNKVPFFSDLSIALLDFDDLKTKWSNNTTVLDELVNATSGANKIDETSNISLNSSGDSNQISQDLPAGEYLILVSNGTDPKEIITATVVNVMPFSSTITVPSSASTGSNVSVSVSLSGAPSENYTYISSIINESDYDDIGKINISWTSGHTLAESVRINGTLIDTASSLTDFIPGSYVIRNTTNSTSDTLTLDTSNTTLFPAGSYWVHTVVFNSSNQSVAFDQSELTLSEQSKGTLKGTVIKSGTGIGISGATVTITNTSLGSTTTRTTDSLGTYSASLYPAIYTINVTKTGYSSNSTTATVTSNKSTTATTISLTTNTVTVTANRTSASNNVTGQNVSFNLTVINTGDNATFNVVTSATNVTNVTNITTPSPLLLNTTVSTGYVVITVNNSNVGGWPVTVTISNGSKSASISLYAIMRNTTAQYTNDSSSTINKTLGANVTGGATLLKNTTVTTNATVVGSTLENATVENFANVSGNSTLIVNSTVTGANTKITDGAVIKGATVVDNSSVGNATVQSTNLTDSTISNKAEVTNSTLISATVSNATLTNVVVTTTSTITNVKNLANITIRGVNVTGVAAYDYEGELQGSDTAGSVEYKGINFTKVYTDVRISQLVIEKSPQETITPGSNISINDTSLGTSMNFSMTANLSSPAVINISETGINPDGADTTTGTRIGNFLHILSNDTNESNVTSQTLRLYLDTDPSNYSGGVAMYYYNTSTSEWEKLTTTGSGNESGRYYIEAAPNHFSTFTLIGSTAAAVTTTAAPGNGGTGGPGVTTSEPYDNIAKAERHDKALLADKPVTYTFTAPELGVYEILVTGKENEYDIAIRVEVLKGTSKLVSVSPPGTVYKNLNVWAGTKRIKEALIRFNVENSWLDSNNIASIKMVRWENDKWVQLDTTRKTKGTKYTSYEAKTAGFSEFAIVGLKEGEVVAPTTPVITGTVTPPVTTTPTAVPTEKKGISGFEVLAAMLAVTGALYLRSKERR